MLTETLSENHGSKKESYTIEGEIKPNATIKVGGVYKKQDFAWIPEKVEGKWIWFKFYYNVIKITHIYPAIWGVTDTEYDCNYIDTLLSDRLTK